MLCEKNERFSPDCALSYDFDEDTPPETDYDAYDCPDTVEFDGGTYPDDEYEYAADEYEEYSSEEDDTPPDEIIEDDPGSDPLYDGEYGRTGEYCPYQEGPRLRYALDGVIYEVAEELYFREKAAMENSAEEQPPFHRVFDEQSIERLDEEYYARRYGKRRRKRKAGELTTAKALLLQLFLLLPVVNIIAAAVLRFRKGSDSRLKAYSRAFAIWSVIITSGVSGFIAFSLISDGGLPFFP